MSIQLAVEHKGSFRHDDEDANRVVKSMGKKATAGTFSYLGIFDGHGGPQCSQFCADNLHNEISKNDHFIKGNIRKAIEQGFSTVDHKYIMDRTKSNDISSCSAVVLLMGFFGRGIRKLFVGNVGDARAVLIRRGSTVVSLTEPHTPTLRKEQSRIVSAGGEISNGLLMGSLHVSRALGGKLLKKKDGILISTPFVHEHGISQDDQYLLIATASFFHWIPEDEIAHTVGEYLTYYQYNLRKVCQTLIEELTKRGNQEDVTVSIVLLNPSVQALNCPDNITVSGDSKNPPKRTPSPLNTNNSFEGDKYGKEGYKSDSSLASTFTQSFKGPLKSVRVTVVRGVNLKNGDMLSKSDPFVELQSQGTKHHTTVKNNTLNPEWKESFLFPAPNMHEKLFVKVLDKDVSRNQSIGESSISWAELRLEGGQKVDKTLPLVSLGKPAGQIVLQFDPEFSDSSYYNLSHTSATSSPSRRHGSTPPRQPTPTRFTDSPTRFGSPSKKLSLSPSKHNRTGYNTPPLSSGQSTPLNGSFSNDRNRKPINQYSNPAHVPEYIIVTLHRAKDLVTPSGSVPSASAAVSTMFTTWSTLVRPQTRNPVWEDSHVFHVKNSPNIQLAVYDDTSRHVIGVSTVELSDVRWDKPITQWNVLHGDHKTTPVGELLVTIKPHGRDREVSPKNVALPPKLAVTVDNVHIPAINKSTCSFLVLILGRDSKTSEVYEGADPKWLQETTLDVPPDQHQLHVQIFSNQNAIASGMLDLSELTFESGRQQRILKLTHQNKYAGELTVHLRAVGNIPPPNVIKTSDLERRTLKQAQIDELQRLIALHESKQGEIKLVFETQAVELKEELEKTKAKLSRTIRKLGNEVSTRSISAEEERIYGEGDRYPTSYPTDNQYGDGSYQNNRSIDGYGNDYGQYDGSLVRSAENWDTSITRGSAWNDRALIDNYSGYSTPAVTSFYDRVSPNQYVSSENQNYPYYESSVLNPNMFPKY